MACIVRTLLHVVVMMAMWMAAGTSQAGQAVQTEVVYLQLKPDAVVNGRYVTLADVALVGTANPQLKSMLENMRVVRAPRIGYVEQLSHLELEQLVRTRLWDAGVKAQWSGAQAVKVQSAGNLMSAGSLVETARKFLLKELGARFDAVEVEPASLVADLELPKGQVTFKPRTIDLRHVYSRLSVWVDIEVDGIAYRAVTVPFIVTASRSVYVARRDLPEGTVVSDADFELRSFELRREDISALPSDPAVDMQGAMRMRRQLSKGQVVTRGHLAQRGMVFRGDMVKLVLAQGSVLIETRALAQQDAAIGQALRVKTENSKDAVLARVVSDGVVQAEGMQ